jgi:DNA mismatch repair ATPase MutL
MQDEDDIEATEQQAPALDTLEQVEVPFLDELLLAARGVDGDIYVPVTPFAERLGMAQPRHQITRIRRDETMAEALRTMPIETAGGVQDMQCLRIDMLTLWLATIRAAAVREEIRPTLRQYKREAARAILAYFSAKAQAKRAAIVPTVERPLMPASDAPALEWANYYEAMAALYRQVASQQTAIATHEQQLARHDKTIADHDREIAALSDDMVSVKETLAIMGEMPEPRISMAQANAIQALVSKIHEATHIHQATIFAAFKKQWRIPRYDELPVAQFADAYEWLRQWGRARLPQKGS